MRSIGENQQHYDPIIVKGFRLGTLTQVLGGNLTIDEDMQPLLNIDPNGARDVTFPAPSAYNEGMCWIINNWAGGAEDITVKNSGGSTIGTCSQAEAMLVFIAGGVTYARLLGTTT